MVAGRTPVAAKARGAPPKNTGYLSVRRQGIVGRALRLVLQKMTACVMVSVSYRSHSVSNFHSSLSTATKNCLMPCTHPPAPRLSRPGFYDQSCVPSGYGGFVRQEQTLPRHSMSWVFGNHSTSFGGGLHCFNIYCLVDNPLPNVADYIFDNSQNVITAKTFEMVRC